MEILDLNGIETLVINTKKFKTITFLITFYGDFSKDNATKRSLLTRILSNSTRNYPTRELLTNHLFDLYDFNFSINSSSIHEANITNFVFEVIHPNYISEPSYINKVFDFIREIIFSPNAKENAFYDAVFNEEKKILSSQIENIYNNKPQYALKRLIKIMCEDEVASISNVGTLEDLELITKENLYEFYLEMIKNEMVKIEVIGDFEKLNLNEHLSSLGFTNNNRTLKYINSQSNPVSHIKEVLEKQKINQAQLMIGFRTNISFLDELYIPALVFKMMLGGMASSDLFRIVREENSLAYSVNALLYTADKILIINAGIDQTNFELTKKLIIELIDSYKNGKIRKSLLKSAKDNLVSSIHESFDDTVSTLMFYQKNRLLKRYSISDFIQRIKNVKIEEIIQVSQRLELDTIYMLAGENDEKI